jgi:hypothetical protein
MPTESYRYFWIKVTNEAARASSARAALELQQTLAQQASASGTRRAELASLRTQQEMARWYLAGEIDNGTRIVVWNPQAESCAVDILLSYGHQANTGGIEVALATMPAGSTRETSLAWLAGPVGRAWCAGALSCRLGHAVAIVPNERVFAPDRDPTRILAEELDECIPA